MSYTLSSYMQSSMNYKIDEWARQLNTLASNNAQQVVSAAGFTKTIEAEVIGIVDAASGKYRVKYQNASFEATTENTSVQYRRKDMVLVSLPSGSLSDSNKIIIGLLTKTGAHYGNDEELDILFDTIGRNLYNDSSEKSCSSWAYKTSGDTKIDYRYELSANLISQDEIKTYIKDASHILLKFKLKTDFKPEDKQKHEKFGIDIVLRYKSETTKDSIYFRHYRFEPQHIIGDSIYNIQHYREQSLVFPLEESADFFDGIESVAVFFDSNFDYKKKNDNNDPITDVSQLPQDVFVKDLEIKALNAIANATSEGYHVAIETPKGAYFPKPANNAESNKVEPLTLRAKTYLNGVLLKDNDPKLKYYWFAEDPTITAESIMEGYSKYGKEGWSCLNERFSEITTEVEGEEVVTEVEYEVAEATFSIEVSQVEASSRKFKCVVVYDDMIISSSPVALTNVGANWTFSISSSRGEILRTGQTTTLTCKVMNGTTDETANCTFIWKSVDLNESTSTYFQNKSTLEVSADEIEKSRVYKCGVRSKNTNSYLGCTEITLTNTQVAAEYTLAIKNGNQVFKYDVNGASPVSRRNENPGFLEKLDFVIYDKNGQELTEEAINIGINWNNSETTTSNPNITWYVPVDDTFLEAVKDGETVQKDDNGQEVLGEDGKPVLILPPNEDGYYGFHKKDLAFKIKDSYSPSYSRNQIKLKVNFKPNHKKDPYPLEAWTEFVFTKEGALGTNGTGAVCWIVDTEDKTQNKRFIEINNKTRGQSPDSTDNQTNFIKNGKITRVEAKSYPALETNQQFEEFQWQNLYRKNTEGTNFVYQFEPGANEESDKTTMYYDFNRTHTIKVPQIQADGITKKDITLNDIKWLYTYISNLKTNETVKKVSPFANFLQLKVKLNNKYCYSVMPLIGVKYIKGNNFDYSKDWEIHYKENSGFLSVLYETNGKYPKYDEDNPFELEILKDGKPPKDTEYSVYWYCSDNLKEYSKKDEQLTKNQKRFKPAENYDSYSYANAVYAQVYQINGGSHNLVAEVYIPIYFYINKYFNAAINEWDGNGIEINKKDGIVLSPQVGAGTKESDNSFTGVIIGSKANSGGITETGLFGFNKGQQTIKLDATDGHAEFGIEGKGQIIIDPGKIVDNQNKPEAKIYGGNYVDGESGLEINLTAPSIKFGSGNFKVNPNGHITAKGGGTIAGWNINNSAIHNGPKTTAGGHTYDEAKTGICETELGPYVYSSEFETKDSEGNVIKDYPNIDVNKKTTYQKDRDDLIQEKNAYGKMRSVKVPSYKYKDKEYNQQFKAMAFWAGDKNFMVSHDGYLTAKSATIGSGTNSIYIGKSAYIDNNNNNPYSAIYSSNKNKLNAASNGFYLGTDGIALGTATNIVTGKDSDNKDIKENISKFHVTSAGKMYAREGYIGNGYSGWTIGTKSLYNQKDSLNNSTAGVYIGTDGIGLGGGRYYIMRIANPNFTKKEEDKPSTWSSWEYYEGNDDFQTFCNKGPTTLPEGQPDYQRRITYKSKQLRIVKRKSLSGESDDRWFFSYDFNTYTDAQEKELVDKYAKVTDKFKVSSGGNLRAESGTIGNFKVGKTYIQTVDEKMGMGTGYKAFWSGVDKFYVTQDGKVTCKNIEISGGSISIKDGSTENFKVTNQGYLTAEKATINGDITCTTLTANNGGAIAGWELDSTSISKGNFKLSSDNSGDKGNKKFAIRAGVVDKDGNYPFTVNFNGDLVARSGTFYDCAIKNSCTIDGVRVDGEFVKNKNIPDGVLSWSKGNGWTAKVNTLIADNAVIGKLSVGSDGRLKSSVTIDSGGYVDATDFRFKVNGRTETLSGRLTAIWDAIRALQ